MIPIIFVMSIISLLFPYVSLWTNLDIKSVDILNGTLGYPIVYDVRIRRKKRGVYGFAGTLLITDSLDDYTCQVLLYHSPLRNNVYRLHPVRIPEGPVCPKVENEYRMYLMKDLHKISDFPYTEDKSTILCPMFQINYTYTVNNFEFDKDLVPHFAPSGLYKYQFTMMKAGIVTCGMESFWTNLDIKSFESLNGTNGRPIDYDVRIKRIKKGVYGFAGSVLITDNFDDYTCKVLIYHSPTRNNVYKLHPMRIPEGPVCAKVEEEYRKFLMKDLHEISDLPYSEDKSTTLCPMFKKNDTFTLRNYEFDKNILPKVAQTLLYKIQFMVRKEDIVTCGIEVIFDLS